MDGDSTPKRSVTFASQEDVHEFEVLSEATDSRRGSYASYASVGDDDSEALDDDYDVSEYARQLVLEDYDDQFTPGLEPTPDIANLSASSRCLF